jgi:hypothetical protein
MRDTVTLADVVEHLMTHGAPTNYHDSICNVDRVATNLRSPYTQVLLAIDPEQLGIALYPINRNLNGAFLWLNAGYVADRLATEATATATI